MKFTTINHQKGVGLIEVLVALLILAVAILGFSAMQMSAVRTTDESIMRSRAMTVMRSGAEIMRANHKQDITEQDPDTKKDKTVTKDTIAFFQAKLNELQDNNTAQDISKECIESACTSKQIAERDAKALHNYALANEVKINLLQCPGTAGNQIKRCMIASWGDTTADFGSADNSCADTNGTIKPKANCFVVEAY